MGLGSKEEEEEEDFVPFPLRPCHWAGDNKSPWRGGREEGKIFSISFSNLGHGTRSMGSPTLSAGYFFYSSVYFFCRSTDTNCCSYGTFFAKLFQEIIITKGKEERGVVFFRVNQPQKINSSLFFGLKPNATTIRSIEERMQLLGQVTV